MNAADTGGDEVLLIRVDHVPEVRVIVMHGPVDDTGRERLVLSSSDRVVEFVRAWLDAQGAPTGDAAPGS